MTTQGKQLSHEIPWDESQGGFFALEQSLERQPLQPKERRSLTSLLPGLTGVQIVTADLQADALETVELLDGPRELLKIRITMQLGDQQIASVGWMAPDRYAHEIINTGSFSKMLSHN